MNKFMIVLAIVVSLSGCQNIALSDAFGAGYITVESIAQSVGIECGNTAPGGECNAESVISTAEKDNWKETLQTAKDNLDDGDLLRVAGQTGLAAGKLQAAQALLNGIERILVERGVQ